MHTKRNKSIAIRLDQLESKDFDCIRPWIDPRTFRIFQAPVDNDQLGRLLTVYKDGKPTSLGYRIVRASDSVIIGFIHAVIDWQNNLVHIGQMVIGDPDLRGSGIGTESLRQLLTICFDDLCLHRAQLFVDEDNTGAIACYRKAGFQVEGLMRDASKVGTDYISWHSMSILEEEWRCIEDKNP
ncbi:MAG: GNAT family N-acetyltransferase [FCB group bacterium]|nr:GNAT family N-acetyltransferase [FCB group bacterium]